MKVWAVTASRYCPEHRVGMIRVDQVSLPFLLSQANYDSGHLCTNQPGAEGTASAEPRPFLVLSILPPPPCDIARSPQARPTASPAVAARRGHRPFRATPAGAAWCSPAGAGCSGTRKCRCCSRGDGPGCPDSTGPTVSDSEVSSMCVSAGAHTPGGWKKTKRPSD